MAVRLADVYPKFRRIVFGLIILITAFSALLFFVIGQWFGFNNTGLIPLLIIFVILNALSIVAVSAVIMDPLSALSRAIVHISPQPNDVQPPDINKPHYEALGIKDMVQTIYDHNSTGADTPSAQSYEIADEVACGIIGISKDGEISYANHVAPVVADSRDVKHLTLIFETTDTLDAWLTSVADSKMTAERLWQGVADASPDKPERRIFDVVAYYQKDAPSGFETTLVTIDRTATYVENEESVDFISLAAHELRGPITVIRGYLDVLIHELGPVLQGDQRELVNRLDVSASRLSGYINNILNVAKYDRQHLQLHLLEDKLSHIYATIADDLTLRAQTQGRMLNVLIPDDLPTIAADRNSLSEVLANLVDNAIKYSREGGTVDIVASVDGNDVKCTVRDYGIGIPPSVLPNLFSKFYRSHRSRTHVSGTGLGLYISRAIIESHGGQISANSRDGKGSEFTFTVPTYASVADKLLSTDSNEGIIRTASGWIKNHGKFGN